MNMSPHCVRKLARNIYHIYLSKTITLYELKTAEGFNEILYGSTIWLLPTDPDVSC